MSPFFRWEMEDAVEHHAEGVVPVPKNPNGPGAFGKPYVVQHPDKDTQAMIDEGWSKNAFNQYVSDLISLHRTLPDPRDEWCKAPDRFLKNLPQTSVIICFHNEAWSTLLRTVHSVMDRSPTHLLKEIILVDDASTQCKSGAHPLVTPLTSLFQPTSKSSSKST